MDLTNLPENEMSRRYLRQIMRWIPRGTEWFNDWPGRPNCGHFLGGVHWYGQETAMPVQAFATAYASGEYDPEMTGLPREEVGSMALKGLRYLCFTHDTGPEDCVRPEEHWGREETAGTKWGERRLGFFQQSQCGTTITSLALAAALMPDLVGQEERAMLRTIAEDYMERVAGWAPQSGVYHNTQTEENAWTAQGIAACMMLAPDHPDAQRWLGAFKEWAFRTVTTPQDYKDTRLFADGRTVRDLCAHTFTTLPDGTVENHGIVHPSYLGSPLILGARAGLMFLAQDREIPPHLSRRRTGTYEFMKTWCDEDGAPHCPQGMDWPYVQYGGAAVRHAVGSVFLDDPEGALLERRALEHLQRAGRAQNGRIFPEQVTKNLHGPQDPAIMGERRVGNFADGCLFHRIGGVGAEPAAMEEHRRQRSGSYFYPHGGILLHRHRRGINSLSWRNSQMVLPATRRGVAHVGPLSGSMLAHISVKDTGSSTEQIQLKVRDHTTCACALSVQDIADATVRRRLYFASLPDGRCLVHERLTARRQITVEDLTQGYLCVTNDPFYAAPGRDRAALTLHWAGGSETMEGYVTDREDADRRIDLSGSPWVNVDGRFGIVFTGTGRPEYHNQHHFRVWRAIKDDLTLSILETPAEFESGETISELTTLWIPHQSPERTPQEKLDQLASNDELFAVEVDGYLCAANFGDSPADIPARTVLSPGTELTAGWSIVPDTGSSAVQLRLGPRQPLIAPTAHAGERGQQNVEGGK
mgnify:CR=1 FL=1